MDFTLDLARKFFNFLGVSLRVNNNCKCMKNNIGNGERIFRAILGIAIILLGVYYASWWGAIGIIPLFTALTGWCPLYTVLGVSTNKHSGTGQAKA